MSKNTRFWVTLSALVSLLLASAWAIVARDVALHPASDRSAAGYVH
jgi:hypothetical protein